MDHMENRVAKLEAIADDMRSTLNTVVGQLARIDSKLDSNPIRAGSSMWSASFSASCSPQSLPRQASSR